MPIIRDGQFGSDDWLRPDPELDLSTLAERQKVLLSLDALTEHGADLVAAGHNIGVEISNDVDPDTLTSWFGQLELISILFPKSADGRGFSVATRLRRLGFAGELRATGHLIADQYGLAKSCGFDTVEISDAQAKRQPEAHWIEAQRATKLAYQRGYGQLQNILSARWAS